MREHQGHKTNWHLKDVIETKNNGIIITKVEINLPVCV